MKTAVPSLPFPSLSQSFLLSPLRGCYRLPPLPFPPSRCRPLDTAIGYRLTVAAHPHISLCHLPLPSLSCFSFHWRPTIIYIISFCGIDLVEANPLASLHVTVFPFRLLVLLFSFFLYGFLALSLVTCLCIYREDQIFAGQKENGCLFIS